MEKSEMEILNQSPESMKVYVAFRGCSISNLQILHIYEDEDNMLSFNAVTSSGYCSTDESHTFKSITVKQLKEHLNKGETTIKCVTHRKAVVPMKILGFCIVDVRMLINIELVPIVDSDSADYEEIDYCPEAINDR